MVGWFKSDGDQGGTCWLSREEFEKNSRLVLQQILISRLVPSPDHKFAIPCCRRLFVGCNSFLRHKFLALVAIAEKNLSLCIIFRPIVQHRSRFEENAGGGNRLKKVLLTHLESYMLAIGSTEINMGVY